MKKAKIFLANLILCLSAGAAAYGQFSVGATFGPQVPLGDFGTGFNVGIGFNATARYMPTDNIHVGLNIGTSRYVSGYDPDEHVGLTPVTALFEYHFGSKALQPFVGGNLGLYQLRLVYDWGGGDKDIYTETNFGFAPVAGVAWKAGKIVRLTGSLKYNYVAASTPFSWMGINAGALFTF